MIKQVSLPFSFTYTTRECGLCFRHWKSETENHFNHFKHLSTCNCRCKCNGQSGASIHSIILSWMLFHFALRNRPFLNTATHSWMTIITSLVTRLWSILTTFYSLGNTGMLTAMVRCSELKWKNTTMLYKYLQHVLVTLEQVLTDAKLQFLNWSVTLEQVLNTHDCPQC